MTDAALNPTRLKQWLTQSLGETHEFSVTARATTGSSNITAFIRWGDARWVLRRPPVGTLPPGAHNLEREYRFLAALSQSGFPCPTPIIFCGDITVLGAPFLIMQEIVGFVPTFQQPPLLASRRVQRELGEAFIHNLAELHRIDIDSVGLGDLVREGNFLERQVQRRLDQLESVMSRCRPLPDLVAIHQWLANHIPPNAAQTSIVHGDYTFGNVMYANQLPVRLVATLDWEMASIGDPLMDLGRCISPLNRTVWDLPGIPSEEEMIAHYAQQSGVDTGHLRFYRVLALWRLAIALEGHYARFVDGSDVQGRFARYQSVVPELGRQALHLIS